MKKTIGGYRLIFAYLGIFITLTGLIILLPLIVLVVPQHQDDVQYVFNFLIPGLAAVVSGIALFLLLAGFRPKEKLKKHQDSILLVLIWLTAILISSVPFVLSGKMGFSESVFEATSGYGTVGLTRLPLEMYDSHIYTFYRAVLQFFGGIGLVLIVTSVLSDRYGLKLYLAEGHGDKLIPNLSKSARIIITIYVSYIVLGTIALRIAGVEWFDAMCHSISSVATGGFSTKAGGMVELSGNMLAIEIITMVLMLLGGTNFFLNMLLISGKFKRFWRDIEVRTFLVFFVLLAPLFVISYLTAINPITGVNFTVAESFRYGLFTFMTGMTTTGYSNLPFAVSAAPFTIFFLVVVTNIIGADAGSTAGGVKLYRIGIGAKSYYWTLQRRLTSKRYIYPNYIWRFGERKEVSKDEANEAFGYIILYIILLFVGGFFVSLLGGFSLSDALFEFSNAISSTGLSNGVVAASPIPVLWIFTVGMFAGRLEILAIIYAFLRVGRDIARKETI